MEICYIESERLYLYEFRKEQVDAEHAQNEDAHMLNYFHTTLNQWYTLDYNF